jgi:hypothetical protein
MDATSRSERRQARLAALTAEFGAPPSSRSGALADRKARLAKAEAEVVADRPKGPVAHRAATPTAGPRPRSPAPALAGGATTAEGVRIALGFDEQPRSGARARKSASPDRQQWGAPPWR